MMHKYCAADIRQCIGDQKIVFIGDSRVRQMFWSLAKKLDQKQAEIEMRATDRHNSMSFRTHENPTVEFIWDPYLNSTSLLTELTTISLGDRNIDNASHASIIMIGGGLWFAKNLNDFFLERYSESIERIMHILGVDDQIRPEVDVLPEALPQRNHASSLVLFAPVPEPFYASLDSAHATFLNPARIQPLREKLLQTWHRRRFPVLWAFDLMTVMEPKAFKSDGLHVVDNVASSMVDLMLNAKCNNFLTPPRGYPSDRTCCRKYPQLNWIQGTFVFIAWSSLMMSCLLPLMKFPIVSDINDKSEEPGRASRPSTPMSRSEAWLSNCLPPRKVLNAIAILFLASYYCWWADRTPLLNKLQKHYSDRDFVTLCLATIVVGLLSMHRSSPLTQQESTRNEGPHNHPFLSRDQTDEWKGWMQFIILIYHYTGASRVLWIYKIARLLVASYLFLTGFGHTIFYYEKANYSLRRVAGVLIRLNLLSCTLPLIMKTDYMFYYFAPLVSFWYLVVYATMAIGKSCNKTPLLLFMKIVVSALFMTVVIFLWPGLFESIFSTLAKRCNIDWDVADWHFRLKLDNYIVYFGMLLGVYSAANKEDKMIFYTRTTDNVTIRTPKLSGSLGLRIEWWVLCSWLSHKRSLYLATMLIGCLLYGYHAYPAKDKEHHNEHFSMVSFGPILAFAAIRNSFPWTRRYHSAVFAWMGRHSLETFILQYHIWLAADTKGVLSTGFFQKSRDVGKWGDFALLTAIFLWVSWHVASATQTLTAYIIEPQSMRDVDSLRQNLPVTRKTDSPERKNSDVAKNTFGTIVPRFATGWLTHSFDKLKGFVAEHLWIRLLLILLVLWLLNMVYPKA